MKSGMLDPRHSPYWDAVVMKVLYVREDGYKLIAIGTVMGQLMWNASKLRKDNDCARCYEKLAKGTMAYRPFTTSDQRSRRLCPPCVKAIEKNRPLSPVRSVK